MGLPDVISTSLNVVFCGINPGMRSAAVGLNFANRSNRFWRVLHLAGFTARQLEPEEARCCSIMAVESPLQWLGQQ
jgi:TDG/mug DNA glycosylase family protein